MRSCLRRSDRPADRRGNVDHPYGSINLTAAQGEAASLLAPPPCRPARGLTGAAQRLKRPDALRAPARAHPMPTVTLIDNYDSFTFNLAHYLGALGADV